MGQTMILDREVNTYKVDDFYDFTTLNLHDLNNKLFCTFTTLEDLDGLIESITSSYNIMDNKLFVLHVKSNDEYVCTYNIDQGNVSDLPKNTILVHRKKDSNTLYTKFPINWKHYRNTILLTQHDELKQLKTKIHKIIEL